MKSWNKRALISVPNGMSNWALKGGLQPTPIILEDRIRIFAGFRDGSGVSRVGYIDTKLNDLTEIIGCSKDPVLDVGKDGAFDDNGVVPSAVVRMPDSSIILHYAGYQLHTKTRFSVFGGAARSNDRGETFQRVKKTPVLERTDEDLLFRVAHTVLFDRSTYRTWYGGGDHFMQGKSKTLPFYNIRYMESIDGLNFPAQGRVVIDIENTQHRLGRPYIFKDQDSYFMFYGEGSEVEPYRLAFAVSKDGDNWTKMGRLELVGDQEWDRGMSAYPAIIKNKDKYWLIYNGNNYGDEGFIVATQD